MPQVWVPDVFDDEDNGVDVAPGETLCERWTEFLREEIDTFDLIPHDYHGALSEAYLDAFVRRGPQSIENEVRSVYAETLYQKYSNLIEDFMGSVGRTGVDPRAEAESCGGNFFWNSFVNQADPHAQRNVWDLFKYRIVVIKTPTFPLHYERYRAKRGRVAYKIIKDDNYIRFGSYLVNHGFRPDAFARLQSAEYESEGVGFLGGYAYAAEIVRKISEGGGHILINKPVAGVFDWETSAGAIVKMPGSFDIPFSNMIVEVDGVVRDAYEKRKVRV